MGQSTSRLLHDAPIRARDTVHLNDLLFTLSESIPTDAPDSNATKTRSQAVLLSVSITHDVPKKASSGDAMCLVDCSAVYTTLLDKLPNGGYESLEELLDRAIGVLFDSHPEVFEASVGASLRDISPQVAVKTSRRRGQTSAEQYQFTISGLAFPVRMNSKEGTSEEKLVLLDITIQRQPANEQRAAKFPFFSLSRSLRKMFSGSECRSLNALATAVAEHILNRTGYADDKVTVQVSEPNVFPLAASVQVQITRQLTDFADTASLTAPHPTPVKNGSGNGWSSCQARIALGLSSNHEDRFANIEAALQLLENPRSLKGSIPKDADVSVVDTSFMYETAGIDLRVAHCACLIETNLSPKQLLKLVKAIETTVGEQSESHAPRAVHLDILMFHDRLMGPDKNPVLPHPTLCKRESMLRPLNDMIPDFVHPRRNMTIRALLDELVFSGEKDDLAVSKVMPFPRYPLDATAMIDIQGIRVPPTAKHWIVSPTNLTRHSRPPKTRIMAILDVAPKFSFCGSQDNFVLAATANVVAAVSSGADIIDIRGCPIPADSASVSIEVELQQVIPIIEAIRVHHNESVRNVPISINTSRPEVALKAIEAGANCVHDIYAFMGPEYPPEDTAAKLRGKWRRLARERGVPVVLAHSRGKDTGKNMDYPGGLIPAIQRELGQKVNVIVRGPGGVRRWLVFVDPGMGFSKSVDDQLVLMRELSRVTAADEPGNLLEGYPLLFEPPSEGALGVILEGLERERDETDSEHSVAAQNGRQAAIGAVSCAVRQGASMVRVRSVEEMTSVITLASAMRGQ